MALLPEKLDCTPIPTKASADKREGLNTFESYIDSELDWDNLLHGKEQNEAACSTR